MITDDEAERALDFMRDNARKAAQAKAERVYMTEYRKSVKAQIMRENEDKALGAQEAIAYADARYLTHLKALRDAVEADEYFDWMRVSAEAKISAWQTQSRNQRTTV